MATALCDEHTHLTYRNIFLVAKLMETELNYALPVQGVRNRKLSSLLAGCRPYQGLSKHRNPRFLQDFLFPTRTLLDHLESVEKVYEDLREYMAYFF